jgi:putative iron-regulated protein
MGKRAKVWTALGVAMLAGAGTSEAATLKLPGLLDTPLVLVEGEGGEGGEGGEAGSSAAATYALGSTDANAFSYDGRPVVEAYATHVLKSYEAAKADAQKLQAAVEAFLASPSEDTLKTARATWVAARPAYLRTEAFRFYDGPIEAIESEINAWPMNEAAIDYVDGNPNAGIINDGTTKIDAETLEGLNQKKDEADVTIGWHAIEFLLWGQDKSASSPGDRPYTDYIAGEGNNDRRRAYLKLVSDQLVHELDELVEAWEPQNNNGYAKKFLELEQREAIGRIVNGMAVLAGFEFMSERLAVALDSGDQEDEHSCFSDTTKQDFVQDLEGIKRVWFDTGLDKLVASRNETVAANVTAELADTEQKVAKLGDPWDQVLAAPKDSPQRKDAEAVVAALQSLADAIKAAGGKLGVLVLIPTG